jgi:murein tripeptide amidase MpaA
MKYLILGMWLVFLPLQAQQTIYSRAKIIFSSNHTRQKLLDAGISADHGLIKPGHYIQSVFSQKEIDRAKELGYQVEIIQPDATAYYLEHIQNSPGVKNPGPCTSGTSASYATPQHFNLGSMGGFLTYEQMLDELDEMHNLYPDLITEKAPISNFQTTEGRPIYWMRLSDNPDTDEEEPEILYTAIHHAREPESMQQLIFFMWYLLENYATNPEIQALVDQTEFYFVPMVNPDGYKYNQTTNPNGGGFWRKNRRDNGDGTIGVDLNRNYSFHWNEAGTGPSDSQTYAGPSPFSEPETQAIKWLVNHHEFKMALNNHTYSQLLLFPYGYAYDTPTPDNDLYEAFTSYMVSQNGYTNEIASELYAAAGDSDDWMYGDTSEHDKIFAMTPEIGYDFWPAQSDIIPICKEMMFLNLSAAHIIHNYASLEDNTESLWEEPTGEFSYSIKRMGIFGQGNFTVSVQAISPNINFSGGTHTYNLDFNESQSNSFTYTLDNDIEQGESINFKVLINNGENTQEILIEKTFGQLSAVITDEGNDLNLWNTGNWGISSSQYHSPPSSITDSPTGNYESNTYSTITLSDEIDLSDTSIAYISFWTKWQIETGYDYVQFEISTDNGSTWQPQCGKYTHAGNNQQAEGEPLYDGQQNNWVKEEISLSDYIGDNILVRFKLISDTYEEQDGFYFDDLEVLKMQTTGIQSQIIKHYSLFPVPALSYIEIKGTEGLCNIHVFNTSGCEVLSKTINNNNRIVPVSGLEPGVYFLQIESALYTETYKFIKK